MKKLFVLAAMLSVVLLSGCSAASKLTRLDDVKADEVVVVAKVKVVFNESEATSAHVVMNLNKGPAIKVAGMIDQFPVGSDGYIYAKFPRGAQSIDQFILHGGMNQYNVPNGVLGFDVPAAGPVYIGDIEVNWIGKGWLAKLLEVNQALTQGFYRDTEVTLSVSSDLSAAQEAFNKKFKSNQVLTAALATVTAPAAETTK